MKYKQKPQQRQIERATRILFDHYERGYDIFKNKPHGYLVRLARELGVSYQTILRDKRRVLRELKRLKQESKND